MRPIKLLSVWVISLVGFAAMVACGGGENNAPTATATPTTSQTATPRPTSIIAAVTVIVPTATSQAAVTGTILDRAVKVAPYELDNIRYGGTLRTSESASPPHWDPKLVQSGVMDSIANWFYEKPFGYVANPNNEFATLSPILAESWKASDDLKTYTVTLRKGIKWHNLPPVNGRELVADDLVFSMNRYREKDSAAVANYMQIESIQATDKHTVEIRLTEPNAWAINDLFGRSQYIVTPEMVKESNGSISEKLIGTGPYILTQYSFRGTIRGVRNPNYWQKDSKGNQLPYIDELNLSQIADQATLVAAFRTGQLDRPNGLLTQGIIDAGKSVHDARVFNLGRVSNDYGLSFNARRAPWNDVRVRRAFGMALNQTRYTAQTYGDLPVVQSTPLPWEFISDQPFTFDKLGPYYQFNPQEAKKLLTEAGFTDGKMTVATPLVTNFPGRSPNGVLIQQLYKEQGIDLQIQQVDGTTFGTRYYQRVGQDLDFTFHISFEYNLNWYAQNKFLPDASQNTAFINDPAVTELVKKVKVTTDQAKIREYAKFLWDYETQGMYAIWVPNNAAISAVAPRVRNWTVRYAATGQQIYPWLADATRTSP